MSTSTVSASPTEQSVAIIPASIELARDLLARSQYYSLRSIDCLEAGGLLVLKGTVANYHLKQLAQTIAISVAGLGGVRNEIQVASSF